MAVDKCHDANPTGVLHDDTLQPTMLYNDPFTSKYSLSRWTSPGSQYGKKGNLDGQEGPAHLGEAGDYGSSYPESGPNAPGVAQKSDMSYSLPGHTSGPLQDPLVSGVGGDTSLFYGPNPVWYSTMWPRQGQSNPVYGAGNIHVSQECAENAWKDFILMSPQQSTALQPQKRFVGLGDGSLPQSSRVPDVVIGSSTDGIVLEPSVAPSAQYIGKTSQHASWDNSLVKPSVHASEHGTFSINEEDDDPENDISRDHPLYQEFRLDDNGMYHCPFEGKNGCEHLPTKHKSNYDKYVDSHLRPHKCTFPECNHARFSSAACRLRHERETHGSHGHGLRPYLCLFPDCERAKPGNGFPRSWNCNDHMKRVHGQLGPVDAEGDASPSSTRDDAGPSGTGRLKTPRSTRKRGAEIVLGSEQDKRAKMSHPPDSIDVDSQRPGDKLPQTELELLETAWRSEYDKIRTRLHQVRGPLDMVNILALHKETTDFLSTSTNITRLDKLEQNVLVV